jgi:hypothetical protein
VERRGKIMRELDDLAADSVVIQDGYIPNTGLEYYYCTVLLWCVKKEIS